MSPKRIICNQNGSVYPSILSACRAFNIAPSVMSNHLKFPVLHPEIDGLVFEFTDKKPTITKTTPRGRALMDWISQKTKAEVDEIIARRSVILRKKKRPMTRDEIWEYGLGVVKKLTS